MRVPLRSALLLLPVLVSWADEPDPESLRERARAVEAAQEATLARAVPSVCAIFPGQVGAGGGSGVLIHPDGYAVSNFHVTEDKLNVQVGLPDGRVYPAKVLGIDPGGDIALLKLSGMERFPYAVMADSDAVEVGERCFAIGNPFLLAEDFRPTITAGIVCGIHRYGPQSDGLQLVYADCIETDASINPGNSGGPLFNARGELIGINGKGNFRPDRPRINVGVGYAVSINQVRNFLSELRACRIVEHGTLDARVEDRPDPFDPHGPERLVTFAQRYADSVAARAGIELGDVLVSFDGVPIRSQNQFLNLVMRLPAGRRVELVVRRPDLEAGTWTEHVIRLRLAGIPVSHEADTIRHPDHAIEERDAVLARFRETSGTAPEGRPVLEVHGRVRSAGGEGRPFTAFLVADRWSWSWREGEEGIPPIDLLVTPDGARERRPTGEWVDVREGDLLDAVGGLPMLRAFRGDTSDLAAAVTFTGGDVLGGEYADRLERDAEGIGRQTWEFERWGGHLLGWTFARLGEEEPVEVVASEPVAVDGVTLPRRLTGTVDTESAFTIEIETYAWRAPAEGMFTE